MTLQESVRLAWDSLVANKLRSILTMLGIIIGVGAVVALMAIGQGAQDYITGALTSTGTNLLVVVPGAFSQGGVRSGSGNAATLTREDAAALANPDNCPYCSLVAPEIQRALSVVYGSQNNSYTVSGTTPEFSPIRSYPLAAGAWFTAGDVAAATNVAVVGSGVAADLFEGADPLGETIRINRLPFRVVGVGVPKGGLGFASLDNEVYIPITTAGRKLFGDRQTPTGGHIITTMYIQVDAADNMVLAQAAVTDLLHARHRLLTDANDFTVINQADLLATLGSVVDVLTLFLGAIAGISLLVGGIGIMNIMLVSVTERTREIGIRKAVGAQQGDILRQFLIEAVLMSVTGGLLGIALGFGLSALVGLTGTITPAVTPGAAILAVGFSLGVGLFFGIYPARRAARLDPIVALRFE